jgi:ubiquinone/menaquinone biosynthesis C-methylase UbiE
LGTATAGDDQDMNHADHVALLRGGVPGPGGVWADFGSGTGAFTLALADLIGPEGEIYSIDKDASALREQERTLRARFPDVSSRFFVSDFAQPLALPPLDGAVMANALHFYRAKDGLLQAVFRYLKPDGCFILVEYNVDRGNPWVPYPLSYATWESLARRSGFVHTRLLARAPSRFLGEIYSAVSLRPTS